MGFSGCFLLVGDLTPEGRRLTKAPEAIWKKLSFAGYLFVLGNTMDVISMEKAKAASNVR